MIANKKMKKGQVAISLFFFCKEKNPWETKESRMKKGQVAIEFMALVGVAILLLLLFTGVVAYYLKITTQQQNAYSGQGLAMTIRQEINTASIVENNYERKIKIPGQLDGKNYRLAITGREVTITYAGNDYSELLAIDTGVGITADENVVKRHLQINKNGNGVISLGIS